MNRLKTFLTYSLFTEIEFRFKTCWIEYVKKYYTTPQQKQFFYNYVIEVGEGNSFWFGFCHNTERRSFYEDAQYNFTIEFNPNKIKDDKILKYLLSLSGKWFIKSYDLAMDLKINILDIITDVGSKKRAFSLSYGFDNKTFIYGKGDGRVKIYNKNQWDEELEKRKELISENSKDNDTNENKKEIESNLNISGDLTRVEISRECDDFPIREVVNLKYDNNFPDIYLNQYIYSLSDYQDKTLFAILFAVQNGFPIKYLSRSYKSKIKNLLNGGYKVRFNNDCATQVLRKTIFHYFLPNNLVKFK